MAEHLLGIAGACFSLPHALTRHVLCPRPFPHSIFDCNTIGVSIQGAGARGRIEGCDISRSGMINVSIRDGASVDVTECRIHGGIWSSGANVGIERGVDVCGENVLCKLERNEIFGHVGCGVYVGRGGDPLLVANTIRDHFRPGPVTGGLGADFSGAGLYVLADSAGCATVRPDNVFLRNALGDVVRRE